MSELSQQARAALVVMKKNVKVYYMKPPLVNSLTHQRYLVDSSLF